jgi:hypothetical protein
MLNEDLEEMLKSKVEKLYEEIVKKKAEMAKRKTLIDLMKSGVNGNNGPESGTHTGNQSANLT